VSAGNASDAGATKLWIEHLAGGIEIVAAAIVGLAAAEAV
jgi:hypothetical protein